jgi:hypothetical protein
MLKQFMVGSRMIKDMKKQLLKLPDVYWKAVVKTIKQIRAWLFEPKKYTQITIDRSTGYKGPSKPLVKTVYDYRDCQLIEMKDTGELGALVGPRIFNGQWDGSYKIIHQDNTIGYWYPSKFKWRGFTIEESIKFKRLMDEKEKVTSKRNAAA